MAKRDSFKEEPEEEVDYSKESFETLKTELPERNVEMPEIVKETEEDEADEDEEDPNSPPKSLFDEFGSSEDKTDFQAALVQMFPDLGDKIVNSVQLARVSPDVFLPLFSIMSTNEIMKQDPRKPINVVSIYQKNYSLLSIGLDGKGRIDLAELYGVARDTKNSSGLDGY